MSQGKFIVIEGLDGCGKTTQAKLLCSRLCEEGISARFTAEPTEYETGKLLRRVLSGDISCDPQTAAALFTADRINHNLHQSDGIEALISQGITVVSDRYYYSSMAYQGKDADPDWVRRINTDCPYIRKPDLCIFLEADTDICLSRIASGRTESEIEIFENRASLESIRSCFNTVFADLTDEKIIRIDASGSVEEISDAVFKAVKKIISLP